MHRRATRSCHSTLCSQSALCSIPRRSRHVSIRHQSSSTSDAKEKPLSSRLSKEEIDQAKRVTMQIIDRVARPPPGWKHTHTLRGEEKRLSALIPLDVSSKRGLSIEKATYDADQEHSEEEGDSPTIHLSLGTFVEARRNHISTHGVVLGHIVSERRKRLVVLTTAGEVWQPVREDIAFNIPDFVSADLVARCGQQAFPAQQTQKRARVEVLKRLKELSRTLEKTYNPVSQKSAQVYNTVSSSDPNKWSQTTTTEVARLINPNPDKITLFATHNYLMTNSLFFTAHHSYGVNEVFHVRPKSHVDNIHTIRDWSRLHDGPIQSFAGRARKVIAANQEAQKLSRTELPCYSPATHVWTESDRKILMFLQHSLRRTRTTQQDPYSLGQSFILKQIHPMRPCVNDDEVQKTLVDLGVLAPWQDLMMLEPALDLDLEPEATSSTVRAREAVAQKGIEALASSTHKTPLGPEDLYPSDPLDSVRHDFGDLPVFVVDEASAEELDDGVSIERIPSEPDSLWAHVHIADPASLIPPTHILAKEASIRSESVYFIHRSWPLFPRSLMEHPKYGLSLGAREDGLPTKVLTFSTKVNSRGEVIDFKVRAGLIRKIHVITYDEVDAALGSPEVPRWYPFGSRPQPKPTPRPLTESQVKDLRDLYTASRRLVDKRQRDGVLIFSQPVVQITSIAPPPSELSAPTFEPTTFKGFPTFGYSVADMFAVDTGARSMVAEMMKLASRAASRFATERGLPMIRRGSDPRLSGFTGFPQELSDMRTSNNYVRHDLGIFRVDMAPIGEYSLEPMAHYALGIAQGEGYTRATSPLRRYLDLVAHWQIHHALLGSAAPTTSPPFDTARLSELSISVPATDALSRVIGRTHQRYWQLMLLKRWAEDTANGVERGDDPLQRLEGVTLSAPTTNKSTGKYHVETHIRLLGINVSLEDLDTPDIPPGTTLPVKIQECLLGVRPRLLLTLK